jgi:hypothetical protein
MKEGRGRERETSQCGMGRYGLPVSMPKGLRVDALMQAACPPPAFRPAAISPPFVDTPNAILCTPHMALQKVAVDKKNLGNLIR